LTSQVCLLEELVFVNFIFCLLSGGGRKDETNNTNLSIGSLDSPALLCTTAVISLARTPIMNVWSAWIFCFLFFLILRSEQSRRYIAAEDNDDEIVLPHFKKYNNIILKESVFGY